MNRDEAETIALSALTFLAEDERRLGALLAQSGWSLEDLRAHLRDSATLTGILEFLAGNEPYLIAFRETTGTRPESVLRAAHALGGARDDHA